MASIGSYYVRIMPDMSKFNGTLVTNLSKNGVAGANAFGGSFSSNLRSTALGMALGQLFVQGWNSVMGGLSTGIERLDIIRNYPRVLANLGFSAEEAEVSVERIQEALMGLPTSLQSGVQATQRLTTSLGDVERATDVFIAFNNALVAGAAPASLQASALEQFAQAVSKGKPDMLEWRSLVNAMPAQIEQVAQSMGMTSAELGEGLRQGQIPMEDFLDAIVALNEEGYGEFASFADQAKTATNTIGTALTNVTNRIGAGWANILDVFGQENIANSINSFSMGLLDAFDSVAGALQWLKDEIAGTTIGSSLETISTAIGEFIAPLASSAKTTIQEFVSGGIQLLSDILQGVAENLPTISSAFETFSDVVGGAFEVFANIDFSPITDFVSGTGDSFAGMIERIQQHIEDLQPHLDNIDVLWARFSSTVATIVEAIAPYAVEFFAQLGSAIVGLLPIIAQIIEGFLTFADLALNAIITLVTGIAEWWNQSIADIQNWAIVVGSWVLELVGRVIQFFSNLPSALANIWENIKTAASNAWTTLKTNVTNIVESIRTSIQTKFDNLKHRVSTVWENIKKAITDPINAAKEAVRGAIDAIKGFFNFSISWPHIPVPQFGISPSGWSVGDLLHGVIPHLSITWHARGGIIDTPTIFAHGVGERGAELVWPSYEPYMSRYASAIADHIDGGNTYYIDGNMVAADARLRTALETVAECVSDLNRMGPRR